MRLFWQLTVFYTIVMWADSALAQRRPIADDTLGNERSIVRPEENIRGLPSDRIQGGARRGDNLFHSFREFGIDPGRAVYFDDPGVRNILSRVTGGNASEIYGKLGVLGNANLFLLNPNGIIFGPNASLDVRGAFVGTTANAIQFGEQGFFSASDPNAPPLLTMQPSAFLFNQLNPAPIENQSIASLGDDGLGNEVFGLLVPNDQSLVLLGGNITNSGNLNAFGGRVELGSVAGTGTVGLNADGSLSFPDGITRADVLITNGSRIDVASNNGGDIAINARNINILGDSLLRAGIFQSLGTVDSQAGNIVLNATGEIQVGQSSRITNNVGENGIGNSGNIDITAGSLFVTDGTQLQAVTFGQGNAGDVIITATDGVVFNDSVAFSTVGSVTFDGVPVGEGGDVIITAGLLEVVNGAQLQASTFGQGNAGRVIITATDRVVFNGTSADGLPSAAFSRVGNNATGDGGNINITAGSLFVTGDAQLSTSTSGQGNAGNVIINADDRVVLNNSVVSARGPSIIFGGDVVRNNAGNIEIDTDSLEVRNQARLETLTLGQGNAGNVIIHADNRVLFDDGRVFTQGSSSLEGETGGNSGNIEIDTNSLEVRNGASLETSTFGQGNAGNVNINADDRVLFDDGDVSTQGTGGFGGDARGNSGNIEIDTNSLEVRNGASLGTSTFGQGNAGNVNINADDRVLFDDGDVFTTAVEPFEGETRGRGGNVVINTDSLEVRNGAQLQSSTFGRGDAGNVLINADTFEAMDGGQVITTTTDSGQAGDIILNVTDHITVSGDNGRRASGLFASTGRNSSGQGGTIRMATRELDVSDRAGVVVNSQGDGVAGDIDITAQSVQLNRGNLTAETDTVDGGNITLRNLDQLQLRNESLISATAGRNQGEGDGGNITIDADFIVASPYENSDIRANAFEGSGGNIEINTEGLFGIQAREADTEFSDITASSDLGVQGTVNINEPDVDPNQGLIELPENVVDASDQIAQTCPSDDNLEALGEFVVTGRGGLPPDPADISGGEVVLSQLSSLNNDTNSSKNRGTSRETASANNERITPTAPSANNNSSQSSLVEAQGWVVDADGKVALVAETAAVEPHSPHLTPVHCPES